MSTQACSSLPSTSSPTRSSSTPTRPTPSCARSPASCTCPANDVYALTRYDVIRDALGDSETFSSSAIGFNPMVNEALQGTSLASDPPVHTQLRATLSENLTPRALRGLKVQIEEKADALVADLVATGLLRGDRRASPASFPLAGRRRPDRLHRRGTRPTCCAGARPPCR